VATTWATWKRAARPLQVAGRTVAAYDLGPNDGAVVTYLHGYPSASVDVAAVADRLAPDHRIVTLDLPGFGASEKTPGHRHSIHAAADALECVWRDRQISRTVLVAHDYGVSVARRCWPGGWRAPCPSPSRGWCG
jgi:pimeloyl-ACP methyl ester carboxylesterase